MVTGTALVAKDVGYVGRATRPATGLAQTTTPVTDVAAVGAPGGTVVGMSDGLDETRAPYGHDFAVATRERAGLGSGGSFRLHFRLVPSTVTEFTVVCLEAGYSGHNVPFLFDIPDLATMRANEHGKFIGCVGAGHGSVRWN